jgi:preprotein translocase subunit SecF
MEFFKTTNIDFQGKRRIAYIFSGTLILIGIISLIINGGPKYSIDFTGGLSMRLMFEKPVSESEIRKALSGINLGDSEVKTIKEVGEAPDILIRVKQDKTGADTQRIVSQALEKTFTNNPYIIRSVDKVGPKIGAELRTKAILASIITLGLILIYLSWRFEFRLALGGVIAIFHDVLVTLALFSLLGLEVSMVIVAAFLTIIGYSINDSIVVFDRIRENRKKHLQLPLEQLINLSINETLSRTIITSGVTLLVVIMLFLLGGEVIHNFAFALLVGFIVGSYSTIYIASPILLEWPGKEKLKLRKEKK